MSLEDDLLKERYINAMLPVALTTISRDHGMIHVPNPVYGLGPKDRVVINGFFAEQIGNDLVIALTRRLGQNIEYTVTTDKPKIGPEDVLIDTGDLMKKVSGTNGLPRYKPKY